MTFRPPAAAVCAGAAAVLGFSPFDFPPATLAALAVLVHLWARAATPRAAFLAGWLFGLGCALAALLVAVVLLAPACDTGEAAPEGWRRALSLFAHDATLRRTCLASAAGLVVSACVFFQPGRASPGAEGAAPPRRPPRSGVAGA